jgi:hypothetical protein
LYLRHAQVQFVNSTFSIGSKTPVCKLDNPPNFVDLTSFFTRPCVKRFSMKDVIAVGFANVDQAA